MSYRELLRDEYFRLSTDDDARRMRLVRSAAPYPSLEALEATFTALGHATERVTTSWGLLIDSRDAPPRNDPAFEEHFKRVRRPVLARFGRIAVLVRSAAGKLQVTRYAKEDDAYALQVFDEEGDAMAFLHGVSRSSRPPR